MQSTRLFRTLLGCALAVPLAVAGCAPADDTTAGPGGSGSPEILWDTWGVPHIYADDGAGLFYGFGWAQGRNHGDLVLRLLGQSRGRGAEYWGEEHLDLDRWVWTMGIPGRAESWLEEQDPEMRTFLQAFADGFNDYAEQHRAEIDDEVEAVLPITPSDLLAHTQRIIHFTFVVNPYYVGDVRRRFGETGSNAWAIGPERSSSGNAILVSNPHLRWSDLFTWFETQMVAPGIDVYGATLVGAPFLAIAFNEHLGWTHTVNTHDGDDLYQIALDGDGYRFEGEVRPFESSQVELKVKQADGSTRTEVLQVLESIHGPVVASNGEGALALSVVGLDTPHLFRQYWDMGRATDLSEYEAAIRQMQMPMFTFMYADREGNIMHHFGGETPIRPQGDWATWSRPVPGDTSDWTWTGIHPFDDLPTVRNPDSGWLQNANDPPWTTTFPRALDPEAFPPYMAPRFMHFRAQSSARMLEEDESITFEEVLEYKHSSRMELAERILDDLEVAVTEHGDEHARDAMEVLSEWDRRADPASRGGVLFSSFFEQMQQAGQSLQTPLPASGFATPWNPEQPRSTPDGLVDHGAAAAALSVAAQEVAARHHDLGIAWGEVYRLRRGEHDYPGHGGPGALGIFRVTGYSPTEDGTQTATSGDSWISVVEFGESLRARVLLSYGNATQPDSPHLGDQLSLFSEGKLRQAWRSREEIEANLELREALSPSPSDGASVD